MAFDPEAPIPRKTVFEQQATGAGQASYSRLLPTLVLSVIAAALIFLFASAWWLGFFPLVVAAFAMWGVSAKATQQLDITHDPSITRRELLRYGRVAAVGLGVGSALLGSILLLGTTLEWDWLLEILGR